MKIRIFRVQTELPDTENWANYNVAACTAEEAITKATRQFSTRLEERVLGVTLLASET